MLGIVFCPMRVSTVLMRPHLWFSERNRRKSSVAVLVFPLVPVIPTSFNFLDG